MDDTPKPSQRLAAVPTVIGPYGKNTIPTAVRVPQLFADGVAVPLVAGNVLVE